MPADTPPPIAEGPHDGGCLCGAVRFRVAGGLKQVIGCHCLMCRKHTGHFLAFTAAWWDELTIESDGAGEGALAWYRSSDHSRRGFCRTCGSTLFFATDGADKLSIAAGALDDATGLHTVAHHEVASKAPYYEISDGAEQFAEGGDSVPMPGKRKS